MCRIPSISWYPIEVNPTLSRMANQAIKIGALSGIASLTAGLAMQMTTFPSVQDAGYTATLAGIAATCIAGGFGLASDSWKQYRREVHVLADLSEFEMEIGQGLDTGPKDLDVYTTLAARAGKIFEDVENEEKLSDLVFRMQKVGRELARQMPLRNEAEAAINVVITTMTSLRADVGFIGAFADTPLQLSRTTTYMDPFPPVIVPTWAEAAEASPPASEMPQSIPSSLQP